MGCTSLRADDGIRTRPPHLEEVTLDDSRSCWSAHKNECRNERGNRKRSAHPPAMTEALKRGYAVPGVRAKHCDESGDTKREPGLADHVDHRGSRRERMPR